MKPHRSFPGKAAFVIANPKSPLMDQVREVLRVKHYSLRTEEAYTGWVLRFLKYQRDQSGSWKHPRVLGSAEVVGFLNHLACVQAVSAATQNQALNAIVFLYSQSAGGRAGRSGGVPPGESEKASPRGAEQGGSAAFAGISSRCLSSAGSGAVWNRHEADGGAKASGEGCGFRPGADHGTGREGGLGSGDDAAGDDQGSAG